MTFTSVNPYSQEKLAEFSTISLSQVNTAIEQSHKAFGLWKKLSFAQRGEYFNRLAALMEERKATLGRLITLEMGKPIRESVAEIEKSVSLCRYYAEHAETMLHTQHIKGSDANASIHIQPLGTIFGIFPWNYPFWQVLRFAGPSLMAGNTTVVKHDPNVTQCAQAIETLFAEAGFPEHVYQNMVIDLDLVEPVIAHPLVHGVTLTGSGRAGSSVASLAGKYLKKSVLELGGSDPFIVLDDADVEAAAIAAVKSRFINTGQSCIAAKRFIVTEAIAGKFTERFIYHIEALKLGDPLEESTEIGPLARISLLDQLEKQVNDTVAAGAKVLTGGKRLPNNMFAPTLLSNIPENSPAYTQELFGPVASLFVVKNEAEAIAQANDSSFGLGGTVFAGDIERAQHVAELIETGNVHLNSVMRSSIDLPFGGIKNSGYGRELAMPGIMEFVNIKAVARPL